MKLDLREETRRDNTKGIKDVDKASTVELQRTVDTGSPSKGKACNKAPAVSRGSGSGE